LLHKESFPRQPTKARQNICRASIAGNCTHFSDFASALEGLRALGVYHHLLRWLRGSGSQNLLVFGHHKGVLDAVKVAAAKDFKGTGHIRIDGTVNSQERAARVRKFQTSSRNRVAI
jgi:hypothetical protein